jgi:hypothetical protein
LERRGVRHSNFNPILSIIEHDSLIPRFSFNFCKLRANQGFFYADSLHFSQLLSIVPHYLMMQPIPRFIDCNPRSNAPQNVDGRHVKLKFSSDEDARLSQVVAKLGTKDWHHIARCMGSRNARQCRDRWRNYLDPGLRNGDWTAQEDELLSEKYLQLGAKWNKISRFFQGRSDLALRNRWQVLERRTTKRGRNTLSNKPSETPPSEGAVTEESPHNPRVTLEEVECHVDFFSENVPDLWSSGWF